MRSGMRCVSWASFALASLALVACPNKDAAQDAGKPAASMSASAPASVTVATAGDAAPGAAEGGAASTAGEAAYAGTYEAKPATLYIPEHQDWKNTKQAKDDPAKHVGDGNLTIDVGSDGRVTGTVDSGPASPGLISGLVEGTRLTATIRRKEAGDQGLTGSILGTVEGGQITGTVKLSDATAAILREGKVSAKKK
jgi:hypothetical protein